MARQNSLAYRETSNSSTLKLTRKLHRATSNVITLRENLRLHISYTDRFQKYIEKNKITVLAGLGDYWDTLNERTEILQDLGDSTGPASSLENFRCYPGVVQESHELGECQSLLKYELHSS